MKGPSLRPQRVSPTVWYYESRGSITLMVEIRDDDGRFIRTDRFYVPRRKLENSLRRMAEKR